MVAASVATALALTAGTVISAQQAPDEARKAAAEQAAREDIARMAAEQAEAIERARLKAQQDMAREAEQKARAEQLAELDRANAVTPIDIEVVISRFQGDKKVSSLPYALTVNATNQIGGPDLVNRAPLTQLRMGGDVPMPAMAQPAAPDGKPQVFGPVTYQNVGTQIDCRARRLRNGQFEVWLSVADSAVAPTQGGDALSLPVIRKFQSSNNLVLRDGQTRQFTAATDRITGEMVRVDVTLRVVK
jgi:hypothetical protein